LDSNEFLSTSHRHYVAETFLAFKALAVEPDYNPESNPDGPANYKKTIE
jgi:hypothetical protein